MSNRNSVINYTEGKLCLCNSRSGRWFKNDKYHGRRLDLTGFEDEILNFFSDGVKLRKNVLFNLLRQLRKLRTVIATMDSFRFYSRYYLIS